uniref:PX domain-containing protein n=1 Tax=Eutreptiella gymnastica TaxID=73025 RepID=A0A7S1I5P4_9EUGL
MAESDILAAMTRNAIAEEPPPLDSRHCLTNSIQDAIQLSSCATSTTSVVVGPSQDKRWRNFDAQVVEAIEPKTDLGPWDGADLDGPSSFAFHIPEPERRMERGFFDRVYYAYHVHSHTKLVQYSQPRMAVERRYTDFVFLRKAIAQENGGVIIPPLPPRQIAVEKVLDVDAHRILDARRRLLVHFLAAVGSHPVLQYSPTLQAFLELPVDKWQNWCRQRDTSNDGASQTDRWFSGLEALLDFVPGRSCPAQSRDEHVRLDFKTGIAHYNRATVTGHACFLRDVLAALQDARTKLDVCARRMIESPLLHMDCAAALGKLSRVERQRGDPELAELLATVADDVHASASDCKSAALKDFRSEMEQAAELLDWAIWDTMSALECIEDLQRRRKHVLVLKDTLDSKTAKQKKLAPGTYYERLSMEIDAIETNLQVSEADICHVVQALQGELRNFDARHSGEIFDVLHCFMQVLQQHHQQVYSLWIPKKSAKGMQDVN